MLAQQTCLVWTKWDSKQRETWNCCAHIFTNTCSIFILDQGGPCSELTERETLSRLEDTDSVFTSMMLAAQMWSKGMDTVSQISNFLCKDESHIIITILLLLFTFFQPQIHSLWEADSKTQSKILILLPSMASKA